MSRDYYAEQLERWIRWDAWACPSCGALTFALAGLPMAGALRCGDCPSRPLLERTAT